MEYDRDLALAYAIPKIHNQYMFSLNKIFLKYTKYKFYAGKRTINPQGVQWVHNYNRSKRYLFVITQFLDMEKSNNNQSSEWH